MTEISKSSAICFNVQNYSVHDGEGIRTTIFLKGCPLRCSWCCNPESQKKVPELAFNASKCLTCGTCLECQERPIMSRGKNGKMVFNGDEATSADVHLVEICPGEALMSYGREYTADELVELALRESIFYSLSGGGITLSGGEAMMWPDFCRTILSEARSHRLSTALETCGYYPLDDRLDIFGLLTELFFDIKLLDPQRHEQMTGKDNALILNNIRTIHREWPHLPITIRTPVIPNFNDNSTDIEAIACFVRDEVPGAKYELMKFHAFGSNKYTSLGRSYAFAATKADEALFNTLRERAGNIVQFP